MSAVVDMSRGLKAGDLSDSTAALVQEEPFDFKGRVNNTSSRPQ
jgi:hypothetical protein